MSVPEFVHAFNAVEVPRGLRTMDAIDPFVDEAQQDFFDRTIAAFRLSQQAIGATFHIDSRMLVPLDGRRGSDDFLEELWISDMQPIATVLRVRDTPNFQVALFNKHELLPRSIEHMQRMVDRFGVQS